MLIQSLLDTDLYKFTMQQAVYHRFPGTYAEYAFQCRSKGVDLRPFAEEIRAEIAHLTDLRLTPDEAAYLRSIRYLSDDYVDALADFRLNPADVQVVVDTDAESPEKGLQITIAGNWFRTILFEVPILAIVNEVYFRHTQPNAPTTNPTGRQRLDDKCREIRESDVPLHIIEFGTRRRYSAPWQEEVVRTLKDRCPDQLSGTSNVHLARILNLKPFGTMAHEFLQAGQALAPLPLSQKFMLEQWTQEYRGDLGIALSDVVGMAAFLRDFDLLFCKAYDGARHDSGDPLEWGDQLIAHYKAMNIDARTKTAVFSDGLNVPRSQEIARYFQGRIHTMFGIGTNLTNDFDFKALQIVLKMIRCNGQPVAKISDTPGKTMSGNEVYLAYLRQTFGLE
ncbi:MAG: nicotinate phosphoribosyltransferase [Armatimonadaceae bacterium]